MNLEGCSVDQMAGVMQKFLVASMFMWMLPIAILYAFNHDLLPGKHQLCDTSSIFDVET